MHASQRDALVERDKAACIFNRQTQKIDIRELPWAVNMRVVKAFCVEKADVVTP